MRRHGGWKAQRSSSGARATSLETAVAPVQHRRKSACSLAVGFVPPALQRVHGLRPLLKCALRTTRGQRTFYQAPAADGLSGRDWYQNCGTGTNRCFFPVHSHLRLDPAYWAYKQISTSSWRYSKCYHSTENGAAAAPHESALNRAGWRSEWKQNATVCHRRPAARGPNK